MVLSRAPRALVGRALVGRLLVGRALGLALGLAALGACAAPREANAPAKGLGGAIPLTTLVDTAGATSTFPDDFAQSKLTVLVFYAGHCPCFQVHEERLRNVAREYGPRGVRVVYVDSEVSASVAEDARAAAERGLPAIVLDPGAKLANAVEAEYATFTVVFDAEGRARYRGGIDSDKNRLHDDAQSFLRDALDDLLAGKEPRRSEGKTLGCSLQKR